MAFAEIEIGQKYHRHIIGKSGANSKYSYTFCIRVFINSNIKKNSKDKFNMRHSEKYQFQLFYSIQLLM